MKLLVTLLFVLLSPFMVAREGDKLIELLRKGNAQHDVGNYDKALEYYKKALKLDSVSGIVHYEIAYTLLAMKRYDEAAEYSRRVINLESKQQQGAYLLLGSALNMAGNPEGAIKVYLEGLVKFRGLHQLHYNLALAYFDVDNLVKAEEVLYRSLQMKPGHVNSHLLLAKVMSARGQSLRAILALHYALYIDPQLPNGPEISDMLFALMNQAVYSKDSLLDASAIHSDTLFAGVLKAINDKKDTLRQDSSFSVAECVLLSSLKEIVHQGHPLWSELYGSLFFDLYSSGHCEAFSYMVARLNPNQEVEHWFRTNQGKVQAMQSWIDSHQPPQKMNQVLFGTSGYR